MVGPTVSDGAIVFADIARAAELPVGWTLTSAPGRVRLERLPDDPGAARTFQYPVSGEGIKPWTFPSRVDALSIETPRTGPSGSGSTHPPSPSHSRSSALAPATSPRSPSTTASSPADRPSIPTTPLAAGTCFVARSSAPSRTTCFCTSMGTGPEVTTGADVVLAELDDGFVVRAPTPGRPAAPGGPGPRPGRR